VGGFLVEGLLKGWIKCVVVMTSAVATAKTLAGCSCWVVVIVFFDHQPWAPIFHAQTFLDTVCFLQDLRSVQYIPSNGWADNSFTGCFVADHCAKPTMDWAGSYLCLSCAGLSIDLTCHGKDGL
jgi:hypothetical protein